MCIWKLLTLMEILSAVLWSFNNLLTSISNLIAIMKSTVSVSKIHVLANCTFTNLCFHSPQFVSKKSINTISKSTKWKFSLRLILTDTVILTLSSQKKEKVMNWGTKEFRQKQLPELMLIFLAMVSNILDLSALDLENMLLEATLTQLLIFQVSNLLLNLKAKECYFSWYSGNDIKWKL